MIVEGLTADNARRLLDAAASKGLDPSVVRTTPSGFDVPDDLLTTSREAPPSRKADPQASAPQPKKRPTRATKE